MVCLQDKFKYIFHQKGIKERGIFCEGVTGTLMGAIEIKFYDDVYIMSSEQLHHVSQWWNHFVLKVFSKFNLFVGKGVVEKG